jgi:Ca2+-binding EF-hand superfamily protein
MRTFLALVSLTLLCGLAITAGSPQPVANDDEDLVILHEARPWRLRLHLQVAGHGFRTGWEEAAGRLFRYLDANGDGTLSAEEAGRAPSTAQWEQMLQGVGTIEPDAAPELTELRGGKGPGGVTPAAFTTYYRRSSAGPLQSQWGPRDDPPDNLSHALFHVLDTNGDGKLSRAEIEMAPTLFIRADADGDEMITGAELLEAARVMKAPPAPADKPPKELPFLLLAPPDPDRALTDRLLRTYDRDGNGKLSRTEIGLDRAVFDRLDANHDGQLDAAELAGWRREPPDAELLLPLKANEPAFHLLSTAKGHNPVRLTPDGSLYVTLPALRVELVSLEAMGTGSAQVRSNLRGQFSGLGKNGVLDSKQIYQPPFTFVGLSRLADKDGDGKLTAKELEEYLGLLEKVVTASTFVTAANRGRSLFEMLDADRDGKLSRRELQSAWPRLAEWDRDGDGAISRAELPRQYLMTIGHGRPALPQGENGPDALRTFRPRARPQGPLWFRKMDRNGDGDVSPAEFLGTPEQFRRLDLNGDGLISVEEARQADKDLRRPKK